MWGVGNCSRSKDAGCKVRQISWNVEGGDFRERLVGALKFSVILLYCVERKLGKKTL